MPTKEQKYVYLFFNCNENKEFHSMNVLHNHEAYSNSSSGRKALWEKICKETEANRINLFDVDAIKEAIIKGNPQDANEYILYGYIQKMEYFV